MDLSLSGLASGFDWKSFVDQMAEAERTPQTLLRSEQTTMRQRQQAFTSLTTQLTALQTSVDAIKDPELFNAHSAAVSDSTLAKATADTDAQLGSYSFSISQFATTSLLQGSANAGKGISATDDVSGLVLSNAAFRAKITDGTFTVDGKQVTVASTDTLQQVFDKISTATGGSVTGAYSASADTITLSKASGELVLGSATDTSNFLRVAGLYNNGSNSTSSAMTLGAVQVDGTVTSANLSTSLSGTSGEFKINGVSISWSDSDSVSNILARINESAAGVTASYDSITDRFTLSNRTTGDLGISLEDTTGNFLAATGLASGSITRGKDLIYSVNDGVSIRSHTNTISESDSGIAGLSVDLLVTSGTTPKTFTVTVDTDTDKIKTAIKDFITAYNKTQSLIDTQTASTTDSTGKVTAGVLALDDTASQIGTSLRRSVMSQLSGVSSLIKRLDDLGIVSNGTDNTLNLEDESKLDDALASNATSVRQLFTDSTQGLGVTLSSYLEKTLGDGGTLPTHTSSLAKQITDIDYQVADLEKIVQSDIDKMTASFVAMESAQAKINQQLTYLNNAFSSSSS